MSKGSILRLLLCLPLRIDYFTFVLMSSVARFFFVCVEVSVCGLDPLEIRWARNSCMNDWMDE